MFMHFVSHLMRSTLVQEYTLCSHRVCVRSVSDGPPSQRSSASSVEGRANYMIFLPEALPLPFSHGKHRPLRHS